MADYRQARSVAVSRRTRTVRLRQDAVLLGGAAIVSTIVVSVALLSVAAHRNPSAIEPVPLMSVTRQLAPTATVEQLAQDVVEHDAAATPTQAVAPDLPGGAPAQPLEAALQVAAPTIDPSTPSPVIVPAPAPVVVAAPAVAPAPVQPTFNGRPIRKVRTIRMLVTGYSPDARSCGKFADGITASGYSVWTNGMKLVAADTRILPFGSIVTVPGYNGGRPVPVLDRGGKIKGHRLDLLFPTHEIALNWGAQRIHVDVWEYAD